MPVEKIFRQAFKLLRSRGKSKIIHTILAFVTGFALVYCFNLIRLNPGVITWITTQKNLLELWVQQAHAFTRISFSSFTPDVAFLSDVIAFQGAVIAIAYPLSLEIVSRISERYSSNVITRKFSNEWTVKILPYLVIANVIIAVLLKFFYVGELSLLVPRTLAWITITIFLLSTILLIMFFNTLREYATNSKHIIDKLLIDMKGLIKLKTKKNISESQLSYRQNKLIAAFEGTGDVLSFEVSRRRNDEYLVQTLNEMRQIIKEFLDLQVEHQEEFERLLFTPEFYKIYKSRPNDAKQFIYLKPEDCYVTFTAAISQFSRIHETAIEAQNLQVGKPAIYGFIKLLSEMSEKTDNASFIKQVLKSFSEIMRKAVAKGNIESAYEASVMLYINIVFNKFSNTFNSSYLDLFDEYFFQRIQFLISQGSTEVFQWFVSALVNTIYTPIEIEKPEDLKENIISAFLAKQPNKYNEQLINEKFGLVINLYKKVNSLEEYNRFVNELNSLSEIEEINNIFESNPNLIKDKEEIKSKLLYLVKIRRLDGLVIALGAYCLFKQRYDYINYTWEFNQPSDSDAMWMNRSIAPSTFEETIFQYSRQHRFASKFSIFWDDHHGAKVYFDKYFLLLLLRTFSKEVRDPANLRQRINSFQILEHTDIHFLNVLKNNKEYYISLAGEIRQIPSLHIRELGLDTNQINFLLDEFLIPFLMELEKPIEYYFKKVARVKRISKAKVQELRSNFINTFSVSTRLRNIFYFYDLFRDRSKETIDISQESLSHIQLLNKEAFFEDWYKYSIFMGEDLGRYFASKEDTYLTNKLIEWGTERSIECFFKVLNTLRHCISNIIIIEVNSRQNSFIKSRSQFKSRWTNQQLIPKNVINSLAGWLTFSECDIPVYKVYCELNEDIILILNKENLALFIQKSPLHQGRQFQLNVDLESKVNFFCIDVAAFSNNQVLLNSFLENPPSWFENNQEQAILREFLETQVLLEVEERFDFLKDEQFEGYVLKIQSKDDDMLSSNHFISNRGQKTILVKLKNLLYKAFGGHIV